MSGGKFLAATLALLAAVAAYGAVIEPNRVAVTAVRLRGDAVATAFAGRTVALLSDLHFDAGAEPVAEKALQRLAELRPDLILLAGDFVAWGGRAEGYDRALGFLARLEAPLGVFAVLGDADRTFSRKSCEFCHREGTGEPTTRHRVTFLKDSAATVETGHGEIRIAGIDVTRHRPFSAARRRLLLGVTPTIVLSHSSLVFREIPAGRNALVLAGDTHGGQVRLPGWFWRLARLKPDPAHLYGLFRDGRKTLFVTRGLGTSKLRFRLGAPPEIVLFSFEDAP